MPVPIKPGYKSVELTGSVAYDNTGFELMGYFQYRASLSEHAQYWLNSETERLSADRMEVLHMISQDLMEQDYSEVSSGMTQSGNVEYNNKVAHHQNHGTAHGLRQRAYQIELVELIKKHGLPDFQAAMHHLTPEEVEIIHLAGFMHRLGRTNERRFEDDKENGARAVQIFKQIASELGFNSALIETVSSFMHPFRTSQELIEQNDKTGAPLVTSGFSEHTPGCSREKAIAFQRILEIAHFIDLVRCKPRDNYQENRDRISERLQGMMQPGHDELPDLLLRLGGELAQSTGAPVRMLPKGISRNVKLTVKAATEPYWAESVLADTAAKFMHTSELGILPKPSVMPTRAPTGGEFVRHYEGLIDSLVVRNESYCLTFKTKAEAESVLHWLKTIFDWDRNSETEITQSQIGDKKAENYEILLSYEEFHALHQLYWDIVFKNEDFVCKKLTLRCF